MFKSFLFLLSFLFIQSSYAGYEELYSKEQLSNNLKSCSGLFFNSKSEELKNKINSKNVFGYCSDEFGVIYSGETKTPLVVFEKLNKQKLKEGGEERTDNFYSDPRIKNKFSANLNDYKNSGYDRGHMFPAANSSTPNAMAQSFSLSNIVPQNSQNNRKTWNKVESDVRKFVSRSNGDFYIVTGVLFKDKTQKVIGDNVYIPSHLYKIVYSDQTKKSMVFLTENSEKGSPFPPISLVEFDKLLTDDKFHSNIKYSLIFK
jgi:DNA/RNA endonuclease G (NUC1)